MGTPHDARESEKILNEMTPEQIQEYRVNFEVLKKI